MKRIGSLALILGVSLGLASCYFHDFRTGGLSMDFSGVQARQPGDVVRVYLLADGLLFSTGDGTPFAAEVTSDLYAETKVRIDGLPAGPTYQALVGLWQADATPLVPNDYGESELFKITPGADTVVSVTLDPLPFSINYSPELMSRNIKAVGNNFGSMIAAEDSRLYYTYLYYDSIIYFDYVFSAIGAGEQYDLGAVSLRANGLSTGGVGSFSNWLNTNNGIFPFLPGTSWSLQTDFNSTLTGPRDILESGTAMSGLNYALFFRRTDGLGGSLITPTARIAPLTWSWVNVDLPGLTDMALGASNAFFVASGKGFALPPAFLTDPDLAKHRKEFSAPAPILSLAVRPGAGSPIGLLYMGTTDGVWYMSVDESNLSFGATTALTQIPETAGQPIEQIAFSTSWLYNDYQAYLSRYWLFVTKGGFVYKIPFYAIFPGKPTGIAWDSNGVYVSGTEGLAGMYLGS